MRIRLAVADDREAVERCVHEAYAHDVPRIGRPPLPMTADYSRLMAAGSVHVAEDDGHIVGVLVLEPEEQSLLIENVAVRPDRQGTGLGTRLLAFAEAQARARHLPAVRLYTHELMTENQRFYRARGFVETARRTEQGVARVFMSKTVAPRDDSNPPRDSTV
ncbi:MAG TPA: GNAT family N-acetyltransferase [Vicinamibacterales bacterium]